MARYPGQLRPVGPLGKWILVTTSNVINVSASETVFAPHDQGEARHHAQDLSTACLLISSSLVTITAFEPRA